MESAWSWRGTTRRAVILAIVVGLVRTATWRLGSEVGDWGAYLLADCTIATVVLALFAYVRELAVRIPHRRMAQSAAILKWLLAVSFLVYEGVRIVAETLGSPAVAAGTGSTVSTAYMLTLFTFGVFIVCWIWSCIVLGRCPWALQTALAVARSLRRAADTVPIARPVVEGTKDPA
jgi:hypothetical protein